MRAQSIATLPFPITTARSHVEVELEVLEIGVAVVPGDERRRGPRARQVLAGDPEPPVGLRADRVDDRVVERAQLLVRHGRADLDVAEEAKPGPRAVFSNARETALMFSWSGATPSRTSPHGVGSRSIRSTSTRRFLALQGARRRRRSPPGRSRRRRREARGEDCSVGAAGAAAAGGVRPAPRRRRPGSCGRSRTQTRRSGSRS